jgi:hypothetical protein
MPPGSFDVERLQKTHLLEQFQRSDAAVRLQRLLRRLHDPLLKISVWAFRHLTPAPALPRPTASADCS